MAGIGGWMKSLTGSSALAFNTTLLALPLSGMIANFLCRAERQP